ncbi:MAG: hypothetical protein ACYC5X_08015 [Syntrophales bacterium]
MTALPPPQAEKANSRKNADTSRVILSNVDFDLISVISPLFSEYGRFPEPLLSLISFIYTTQAGFTRSIV